ncbi:hypothetical protein THAOC_32003 [Thalassiosira oceanica]|uniref:Uncharacterized protein n=1 Tax=Thalassiosira oceanica TaxID=159749 RepID=K0R6Z0_THAOC|nr:hypothetical protein THAOC_32003 [Thalassiosira oceanica]|eukprot:EJK49148.1 hypothetical protein THAOC_32003 [Thalassiosira oceanica]
MTMANIGRRCTMEVAEGCIPEQNCPLVPILASAEAVAPAITDDFGLEFRGSIAFQSMLPEALLQQGLLGSPRSLRRSLQDLQARLRTFPSGRRGLPGLEGVMGEVPAEGPVQIRRSGAARRRRPVVWNSPENINRVYTIMVQPVRCRGHRGGRNVFNWSPRPPPAPRPDVLHRFVPPEAEILLRPSIPAPAGPRASSLLLYWPQRPSMGLGRPVEAPNILIRCAAVGGRWLDDGQIHHPRRTDGRFESEPSKGCLLIHVVSGMPQVVRSTAGSIDSNPMLTLPTVDFLCGRAVGASTSSASRRSLPWSETRHVIYRWNGLDVISTTVHCKNMIRDKTRTYYLGTLPPGRGAGEHAVVKPE